MPEKSDLNTDQIIDESSTPMTDSSTTMDENAPNNRRIAKNAVALYVRMFFTLIVGLYTSRVVLNTLGVEDFGIYGLVGSILAMLSFLNASMGSATSRFITYELGRGDKKTLAETFSSAMIIHLFIALLIFVLAETVGLWFLMYKLVIPPDRMYAAHWVYQLSIVSAMIGITQAPYGASIVSHEKMEIFAYFEIVNSLLRLLIVYLLVIGNFDKLILYAVLSFTVSVLIRVAYRIYCIRHFQECRFHWVWKKSILLPMLNFSGWDLYGNGCVAVRAQGINFLINIFFGVAYNAANSIAITVQGLFNQFVMNITQAFRPVIIKSYAVSNISEMQQTMMNAIKLCSVLFSCIFFPMLLNMSVLLKLWLVDPPFRALEFSRLTLCHSLFFLMTSITNIGIHATGRMKRISFISGTLLLLNFPIVYGLYKFGLSVDWAYYVLVATSLTGLFLNAAILKYQIPTFNLVSYFKTILSAYVLIICSSIPSIAFWRWFDRSIWFFLLLVVVTSICVLAISYKFFLNEESRMMLKQMILKFIHFKKN